MFTLRVIELTGMNEEMIIFSRKQGKSNNLNTHAFFDYHFQSMGKNKMKNAKKGKTASPTVTTADDGYAAGTATGIIREATVALTRLVLAEPTDSAVVLNDADLFVL